MYPKSTEDLKPDPEFPVKVNKCVAYKFNYQLLSHSMAILNYHIELLVCEVGETAQ